MSISNDELTAWEKASAAATEGPWQVIRHSWEACSVYPPEARKALAKLMVWEDWGEEDIDERALLDARFIALARTALPRLIAEVERLRQENEEQAERIRHMEWLGWDR